MTEYRIDDLARAAGTTTRNVRAYQEGGLLPPPRRAGRVGIYTDAHLARLRLIGQLLERGYAFAHIRELVSAWEQGRDLSDVLGLEQAIVSPWTDEIPTYVTGEELTDLFDGQDLPSDVVERVIRLGLVEPEGDRFRVPSPRLLNAGADLVRYGFPLSQMLDLYERVGRSIDEVAGSLVEAVAAHIFAVHGKDWLPRGEEVGELAAFLRRTRQLTRSSVEAVLGHALERHTNAVLGEYISRVVGQASDVGAERRS